MTRSGFGNLLLMLLLVAVVSCSKPIAPVHTASPAAEPVQAPDAIPAGAEGALIWRGKVIFDHTPQFATDYVRSRLTCSDCHLKSGTQPFSAPMYGIVHSYPSFSGRAGHVITLQQRLQECFVRSENGPPPPLDGDVMRALTAYLDWLSRDATRARWTVGQGYGNVPDLKGNGARGRVLYGEKCAGCHGKNGAPNPPTLAPLWGEASWNDGAGMNIPEVLAAFVQHNMPADKPGSLTPQQAFDIAAYVDSRPRPKLNPAYRKY